MSKIEVKDLLDAGVHFGHLTRKWNPNMAPYIYMERNGIHIINLYKSVAKIEEANEALKKIAASGRKILFVATKKQAKDIVSEKVANVKMPYITERWPGGMLTNFVTIRKAVKKMAAIDKMKADGTFETLSKKEKLQVDRLRAKLEKNLGSISDMTRLPGALFVVDTRREHIAVKEAQKLNIPIFAMVDTNADPREVDYVIPANDDASKSIEKIMTLVTEAVAEGLQERQKDKAEAEAAASEGEVVAPTTEEVVVEPVAEEVVEEAVAEPAAEPVAEEVVEEAVAEPAAEPVAEEVVEEAVAEPVAEEVVEEKKPAAKAKKKTTTKAKKAAPKAKKTDTPEVETEEPTEEDK
jgi:small subunit ribosomal protein S2